MNRIFTLFLPVLLSLALQAQPTTHVGVGVAYSADIFQRTDPGGRLSQPGISAALWGFTVRRTFNKHLFFESGLYARAYKTGIGFVDNMSTQSTDRTGYLLPLRVGLRLPLFKSAVAVCPLGGFTFGITDEGSLIRSEGSFDWTGVEKIDYSYNVQHASQVMAMVQAGLGIDIKLWPKFLLQLNTSYYGGLSPILKQQIAYKPASSNAPYQATQSSKGGFFSIGLEFKYQVNWF